MCILDSAYPNPFRRHISIIRIVIIAPHNYPADLVCVVWNLKYERNVVGHFKSFIYVWFFKGYINRCSVWKYYLYHLMVQWTCVLNLVGAFLCFLYFQMLRLYLLNGDPLNFFHFFRLSASYPENSNNRGC